MCCLSADSRPGLRCLVPFCCLARFPGGRRRSLRTFFLLRLRFFFVSPEEGSALPIACCRASVVCSLQYSPRHFTLCSKASYVTWDSGRSSSDTFWGRPSPPASRLPRTSCPSMCKFGSRVCMYLAKGIDPPVAKYFASGKSSGSHMSWLRNLQCSRSSISFAARFSSGAAKEWITPPSVAVGVSGAGSLSSNAVARKALVTLSASMIISRLKKSSGAGLRDGRDFSLSESSLLSSEELLSLGVRGSRSFRLRV